LASSAFWSLLIVPIGFPIVTTAGLWVITGFESVSPQSEARRIAVNIAKLPEVFTAVSA
jgi:hypothetical protein